MALWTIGDLHLSFGMDKPMDIFGLKWHRHEEKIKSNWQNNVADDDVVVLLGDALNDRKNFIAENGAKYLELADIS